MDAQQAPVAAEAATDTADFENDFDSAFDSYAEGKEPEPVEQEQEQEQPTEVKPDEPPAGEGDDKGGEQPTGEPAPENNPENKEQPVDWEQRYKSDVGRINAYQRQAEESKNKVAELTQQLEALKQNKPPQNNDAADPKPDGFKGVDMEELKEFYPEVHAALVQSQQKLNALETQLHGTQQAQHEQAIDDHNAAILAAHSDVNELINAPEFENWMNQQPPAISRIAEQGSTPDVIWMLDQYKQSRTAAGQQAKTDAVHNKQKDRLKKAATIPNRQQPTNKDDGLGDFESAFNHFADKQEGS